MSTPHEYEFLARKPKSAYLQLFIKDRWIAARTLYAMFVADEAPMTPEEIAADYALPVEAVLEAIAYCQAEPAEIAEDLAREAALMAATGADQPCYRHQPRPRPLTAQELTRLRRR
jgi:uncharacterized protein (DUF433 family)